MEKGKLYICPTPIGNLEDITIRTLETFKMVDFIGAEDTRHSIKLLNHYNISKPLISYHEHNKREKGEELIKLLLDGNNIGLVSDAGMPGISDPGQDLIYRAIEEDIEVVGLPGPTASILALVISGMDTRKFIFEGFLSSKKKERRKELSRIKENKYTSIVYESPHRIKDLLKDMDDLMGLRKLSISRELTKKFEETLRGTSGEILELLASRDEIKGEFVVIIAGNNEEEVQEEYDILKLLEMEIEKGYSKKEAVKKVSQQFEIPKNLVYKESLRLK